MLNSVVLPAPFGPITAKMPPSGTSNESRSTATSPRKRLLILSTDEQRAHGPRSFKPSRRASQGQTPSGSATITESRQMP